MLDLTHPLAERIFDASGYQHQIHLVLYGALKEGRTVFFADELERINGEFLKLKRLNIEHFDEDPYIKMALYRLREQFNCVSDINELIQPLGRFSDEPGDNFGTWAI